MLGELHIVCTIVARLEEGLKDNGSYCHGGQKIQVVNMALTYASIVSRDEMANLDLANGIDKMDLCNP